MSEQEPCLAADIGDHLADPTKSLPPLIDVGEVARRIATLHREQGGSTFNLRFGDLSGKRLYAVSLYPERSRVISGGELLVELVESSLKITSTC